MSKVHTLNHYSINIIGNRKNTDYNILKQNKNGALNT